jgi:phosphoglycerate kinase
MVIKFLKPSTIKNKTVLLRVDVNVPIDNGKIGDAFRIEQILPTVKLLQAGGNRIIICGHLGRPEGRDKKLSLRPAAEKFADLLGYKFLETHHPLPNYPIKHVIFYTGNIESNTHTDQLKNTSPQDIIFLENLRFYKGEEENDAHLAKKLSDLADVYVNDAFGVDHRKAASVSAITKYLPSYCGLLLEKEIKNLDLLLKSKKKPFVLMMGGIKISDKVETIKNLGQRADKILLGGGIANLFFLQKGYEIGKSKVEVEALKTAWALEKNFKDKIILPLDVVVANVKMERDSIRCCSPHEVKKNEIILDHGPKTMMAFAKELKTAKVILWNGPLGLFEKKPFDMCTFALSRIIGSVGKRKAFVVAGGGETVDALIKSHQFEHIDHVSTGGGAMLEYLAGKKLPGIEALK